MDKSQALRSQLAEQQPRMEGLIAIRWTGSNGTGGLHPSVTSATSTSATAC